jgi:hypothetical protein
MTRERRTSERHNISIEGILETPEGRRLAVRVRDVSAGGAFLVKADPSVAPPPLGSAVQLTIRYQSEHGTDMETVRGRVARVNPEGIAVQFLRDPAGQADEGA